MSARPVPPHDPARERAYAHDLAEAGRLGYDPMWDGAATTSTVPAGVMRRMGMLAGAGPDCYRLPVPDPRATNPGPDGELALVARMFAYRGQVALLVEAVEVTVMPDRMPGLWLNSWSIELCDHGWAYSPDPDPDVTAAWRVDIYPVAGRPSAPAQLHVRDGAGYTLFDGPALLSPTWQVHAAYAQGGLLVLAGPCAGALVPEEPDDERVDDLLGTADLVAARIRVQTHKADASVASS